MARPFPRLRLSETPRFMSNDITENVQLDTDGFLLNADEWSENVAFELASSAGIRTLTDEHWSVITQLRAEFRAGDPNLFPQIRHICAATEMHSDCVTELFGDPKIAWQIAGLPKAATDMNAYAPSSDQF